MAVHLPLSAEAQAEARILMLSSNNILKPSDGRPVTMPSQDMIIGLFHLTADKDDALGSGRAFSNVSEAIMAFDSGVLDLNAEIKLRLDDVVLPEGYLPPEGWAPGDQLIMTTTLGRALFNELLPVDYPYVNAVADKKRLSGIVNDLAERYPKVEVAASLDALKDAGFHWATFSGLSISISDVATPDNKAEILEEYEGRAAKIQTQYDKGEIIPRPIKSNYREGLSVLEYFIASHGARKGLADTALRTADSGYLTRRLVDVSQDVIVREDDCGTDRGLVMPVAQTGSDGKVRRHDRVETSVYARTLASDVVAADGTVVGHAGEDVGDLIIDRVIAAGITELKIRSVLTCESRVGTCARCYGRSLATGKLVDIGEAVGIIAAQSIGEPGTQLTMRTFHTGGVASADDITQGL